MRRTARKPAPRPPSLAKSPAQAAVSGSADGRESDVEDGDLHAAGVTVIHNRDREVYIFDSPPSEPGPRSFYINDSETSNDSDDSGANSDSAWPLEEEEIDSDECEEEEREQSRRNRRTKKGTEPPQELPFDINAIRKRMEHASAVKPPSCPEAVCITLVLLILVTAVISVAVEAATGSNRYSVIRLLRFVFNYVNSYFTHDPFLANNYQNAFLT